MKDLVSRCPIEEVMQILSGRWPTLLIYYLQEGTKRFSDLRRDNPTISHKMLRLELRKLEDADIVRRTEFDGYPLRVEYDLTPTGERLVPLIDALGDWWENTAGNVREQGADSPLPPRFIQKQTDRTPPLTRPQKSPAPIGGRA